MPKKKTKTQFRLITLPRVPARACNKDCRGCPLHKDKETQGPIGTEHHAPAGKVKVMFITDTPGETENITGRPLIGRSGSMLRRAILQVNGSERGVAYGSLVRCWPTRRVNDHERSRNSSPLRNRPPVEAEVNQCQPNILRDIDQLKPDILVLLGSTVAGALAKHSALQPGRSGSNKPYRRRVDGKAKLTTMLGKSYVVEIKDPKTKKTTVYPAIVTYRPAVVLANPKCGGIFKGDIAKAFIRANGPDHSKRGKPAVILDTVTKVKKFLHHLTHDLTPEHTVMLDYETWHPSTQVVRLGMEILTIAFSYAGDRGFVIPYQHPESPFTGKEFRRIQKMLRRFFSNPDVSFGAIGAHNIKYECSVTLDQLGVHLGIAYPIVDTMLRAHQLNENRIKQMPYPFSIKTLATDQLGCTVYEDVDIAGVVALVKQGRAKEVPLAALCEYNAIDCYIGNRLIEFQDHLARQEDFKDKLALLGTELHGPVSSFAASMERNGILINRDKVRELRAPDSQLIVRQAEIEEELYDLTTVKDTNDKLLGLSRKVKGMRSPWKGRKKSPWVFHIGKPAARRALLFDVLKLHLDAESGELVWSQVTDAHKGTKPHNIRAEHLSVNKDFFAMFEGVAEVDLISEWSLLEKVRSTYLESVYKLLRDHPDMRDGRIRGSLNFHTARSSRASMSNPNMQNIMRGDKPAARIVKQLYIVEPGNILVCADYSQAEIRGLAHVSGDKKLIAAYVNAYRAERAYLKNPTKANLKILGLEGDFHKQTASQIFKVDLAAVTKMQRDASKTVVFGIIYGMSAHGLSRRLGIKLRKAEKYIEAFLSQFPEARKWLEWIEQEGYRLGYVESPIGRRRHMLSNFLINEYEEREYKAEMAKHKDAMLRWYKTKRSGRGDAPRQPRRWGAEWSHKSYEDRSCRNSPIQSLASDMNFTACIKLHRHIVENKKDSWRIVNVVHDSIMAEIPFHEVEQYAKVTNDIMSDRNILSAYDVKFSVPLKADFTVGLTWGAQMETNVIDVRKITCKSCGESRKVEGRIKNPACENVDCRERSRKNLSCKVVEGPLPFLLKTLDQRHKLTEFWERA